MPATMLVAVRMIFAGLALGVVVALRRDWKALVADRATTIRLLVCGVALAVNLVSYFIAIRQTGVAVAIFLSYLAPVYVAFVAPHLEGGRTEAAVYAALGVGLAGMALILVPGLTGESVRLTPYGSVLRPARRRDVHGLPDRRQAAAAPRGARHHDRVRDERPGRRRAVAAGPAADLRAPSSPCATSPSPPFLGSSAPR